MGSWSRKRKLIRKVVEIYARGLKRNWKLIGGLFTIGSTGWGLASLCIYLIAIGRVDLFVPSLNMGPSVFIWLLSFLFLALVSVAVFSAPAIIFAFYLSEIKLDKAGLKIFVSMSFWIAFVGWLLLLMLAVASQWLSVDHPVFILFMFVLLLIAVAMQLDDKYRTVISKLCGKSGTSEFVWWKLLSFLGISTLALGLVVVSGAVPASLVLKGYRGTEDALSLGWLGVVCLISMALPLLPVLAFYLKKGGVLRRIRASIACFIISIFLFFTLSFPLLHIAAFTTAEIFELRVPRLTNYVLDDVYPHAGFDQDTWQVNIKSEKLVVKGFQLFAFGDLILICPEFLLEKDLKDLPEYSHFCLRSRGSLVHPLPAREGLFDMRIDGVTS